MIVKVGERVFAVTMTQFQQTAARAVAAVISS